MIYTYTAEMMPTVSASKVIRLNSLLFYAFRSYAVAASGSCRLLLVVALCWHHLCRYWWVNCDLNISRILKNMFLFIGKLLWAAALAVIWRNIIVGWLIVALVARNLSQKAARYGEVIKYTFSTSDLMWNLYFYRSLKQFRWVAKNVQSLKIVIMLRSQIAQSRSRN